MICRALCSLPPALALPSALLLAALLSGCFSEFPTGRLFDGGPGEVGPPVQDAGPEPVDGNKPERDREVEPDPDALPEPEPDAAPEPEPDAQPDPEPDALPEPDMMIELDEGLPDMTEPALDMDPPDMDPSPPDMDPSPPDMDPPPPDMEPPPAPDLGPPVRETCNGRDDNGNGVVDDAPVCGDFIASRCRLYLGWADNNAGPNTPSAEWGNCPGGDEGFGFGNIACTRTLGDGEFRRLGMRGDVNQDDRVAIAFRCQSDELAEVADWVQSRCRVYIGQADIGAARDAAAWDTWGPCFDGEGAQPPFQCVSSGGDGQFHAMTLIGDVNGDDAFAVAFRCEDPEDLTRAAAVTGSAAVVLGWARDALNGSPDRSADWGPSCPGGDNAAVDDDGNTRCASSSFDGRFHRFQTDGDVDIIDAFSIALLPGR